MEQEKIKLYDRKIQLMRELENLLGIEDMGLIYELLRVQEDLNKLKNIEVID